MRDRDPIDDILSGVLIFLLFATVFVSVGFWIGALVFG